MNKAWQIRRTVWITLLFALMLLCVAAYLYGEYAPGGGAESRPTGAPLPDAADPLGLLLIDVDTAERAEAFAVEEYGVYVLAVAEGSPAQRAGLRSGDRIYALNGVQALTAGELYELLARVLEGDPIALSGSRGGVERVWQLSPPAPD